MTDHFSTAHKVMEDMQKRLGNVPCPVVFPLYQWNYLVLQAIDERKSCSYIFKGAVINNKGMALLEQDCSYQEVAALWEKRLRRMENHYMIECRLNLLNPGRHTLSVPTWFKVHIGEVSTVLRIPTKYVALAMFCRDTPDMMTPIRVRDEAAEIVSQFNYIVEDRRRQIERDLE